MERRNVWRICNRNVVFNRKLSSNDGVAINRISHFLYLDNEKGLISFNFRDIILLQVILKYRLIKSFHQSGFFLSQNRFSGSEQLHETDKKFTLKKKQKELHSYFDYCVH